MTDINLQIGAKIKNLRTSYGLSQIQLAEKINLSFQQIQKYEKGTTAISAFRLQQIAEVFNIHAGFFFEQGQEFNVEEPCPEYAPTTKLQPSKALTKEEINLLKSFRKIKNNKLKDSLFLHVKGLVEIENQ